MTTDRLIGRRIIGAIAVCILAVGVLVACSDAQGPVVRPALPSPFVVSSPVPGTTPATLGSAAVTLEASTTTTVVYVSLPPGAIPGATAASIRDRSTGSRLTVPIVDGGFDPVPMTAEIGDTLEVTVEGGGTDLPVSYVIAVLPKTRPVVVRTNPPDHKRDVALNAVVVIVFSQPMERGSLTDALHLRLAGADVAGTVTVAASGGDVLRASFVPTSALAPATTYQVEVGTGAHATNGESLETPVHAAFTTGDEAANVAAVTVIPSPLQLVIGGHQTMTARPVDAAGLPLAVPCVWTTTAAAIAKVTSAGQLSALSPGSATIRATCGNLFGEATVTVVSVPSNLVFTSITASGQTGCGLTAGGKAYCWGINESGELGIGTTTGPESCTTDIVSYACSPTPVAVARGLTFTQLNAGPSSICGVTDFRMAYCWGYGYYTETGISPTSPWTESLPTEIGGLFQTVSAGAFHNCGLTALGAAYCWGENTFGQLGNGAQGIDSAASATPRPVVGGLAFSMLSVGSGQSVCGLTTSGAAYCWGSNRSAQLGIDTAAVPQQCVETWCWSPTPVAVQGGLTFASVSAGMNHNCGVTTAGVAYCWGGNEAGELGTGTLSGPEQCTINYYPTFACSFKPMPVAGALRFASVSAGMGYTCGLTTAGAAYCWGSNLYGALGTDITAGLQQCANVISGIYPCSPSPVAVAGGLTFVSLDHTCGITTSGVSYCWGDNSVGQLGDGTTTSSSVPVKVAGQP